MSLTNDQREKVDMFQSVTNETNSNESVSLLKSCDWNVENAIATYYAIKTAGGSSSTPAQSNFTPSSGAAAGISASPPVVARTGSSSASSFMNNKPSTSNASASSSASKSSVAAASPSPSPSPASSNASSSASQSPPVAGQGRTGWLGSGFVSRVKNSIASRIWGANSNGSGAVGAPKSLQEQFLADLSTSYGVNLPKFHTGSYTDAVKDAKAQGRYLFLYLHSPAHDDTETFVKRTLGDESVINFLGENFVSWAGTIKHADAYRLCQTLQVASFPFICVVAPHGDANAIVMVYRNSGPIEPEELIRQLLLRMEAHQQVSHTMNQERVVQQQQQAQSRSLRELQDAEYAESLIMDQTLKEAQEAEARQTEELLRLSREAEAKAEEERQRAIAEEEARKAAAEAERKAHAERVPPEPAANEEGVVNLGFRLPNGKKVSRRFLDSQSLSVVRTYLQSLEDMESVGEKYHIVSNFPRKVHTDPSVSIGSLKLGKQIQFIVETIADEEEESAE